MGMLRTLFAISVVLAHTGLFAFIGGKYAVQLFYMVSGFLISHVLVEKNVYPSPLRFYANRFLRLYPVYFAISILTFCWFGIRSLYGESSLPLQICESLPPLLCGLLTLANSTLLGQDYMFFIAVDGVDISFTTNYLKSDIVLVQGLWIPQAWTLSVEIAFYLIAPFLLTRMRLLLLVLVASLALRGYLLYIGLGTSDPWSYRFFPTELALFLLGALAHQVGLPIYRLYIKPENLERLARVATYFLIVITVTYSFLPFDFRFKTLALFGSFLVLFPLTFIYQSSRNWDSYIGKLSYPIYICHMLIIELISTIFFSMESRHKSSLEFSVVVVLLSVVMSVAINQFIERPIEALRVRFRTYSG